MTRARARDRRELPAGIAAIYVSPLRALAYDLQKNLQQPLDELSWGWLRIGARTGDTTPAERALVANLAGVDDAVAAARFCTERLVEGAARTRERPTGVAK